MPDGLSERLDGWYWVKFECDPLHWRTCEWVCGCWQQGGTSWDAIEIGPRIPSPDEPRLSGWRDIETAPKDGMPVDLWVPKHAKGNRGPAQRCSDCEYKNGKWKLGGEFELPWLQEATHWMPLPSPPSADEQPAPRDAAPSENIFDHSISCPARGALSNTCNCWVRNKENAEPSNPLPSFDARVWARSFMEHNAVNPRIAMDEETMVTWFANALMRGYDEHANKRDAAPVIHHYVFPWTVELTVDEEGDTIARFTDAPPNISLMTHGKDAAEALSRLDEIVKLNREMDAEEAAERDAAPCPVTGRVLHGITDRGARRALDEADVAMLRAVAKWLEAREAQK